MRAKLMMTKYRAQAFVFWLLPILVLRALMPIGTMLEASTGMPTVVMCSGESYHVTTHSADENLGNTHQQTHHRGDQHSVCPFATVLAAATSIQSPATIDSSVSSAVPEAQRTSQPSTYGPSRVTLTRGPPSLS